MYHFSKEQVDHFFCYLETLDCYIKSEEGMIDELESFKNNQNRKIAALVCQNTQEILTYKAPYIRILYVLQGSITITLDGKKLLMKQVVSFWPTSGQLLTINL